MVTGVTGAASSWFQVNGFALDPAGDIYAAGSVVTEDAPVGFCYTGALCPPFSSWPTDATGRDAFVMKVNGTDGSIEWAKELGAPGDDEAEGIAYTPAYLDLVDHTTMHPEAIWPVGYTNGLMLDMVTPIAGGADAFVARMDVADGSTSDQNGEYFIKAFGSSNDDYAMGVSPSIDLTDVPGAVQIAGATRGVVTSDSTRDPSRTDLDAMVVQVSPYLDGLVHYKDEFGTTSDDYAVSIAAGVDSHFVAGVTWGDLGGTGNAGGEDVFVERVEDDGSTSWMHQLGTSGDDDLTGMQAAPDSANALFLIGSTDGVFPHQQVSGSSVFLGRLAADDGEVRLIQQYSISGDDHAYGTALDSQGILSWVGDASGGFLKTVQAL